MKRILIALFLPLLFLACSSSTNKGKQLENYFASNGNLKVLSTTAMIDDLVGEIGGKEIDHLSLIVGDLDPHSYELVKGDGEKLERADLIFSNGLGLEHGASLRQYLEQKKSIALGDTIFAQDPKSFLKVDGQIDPHIWMDMELFARVIDPIVSQLSVSAPEHALLFEQRGKALKAKLLAADEAFHKKMQSLPSEKRYLVTSHDAFNYFTKKYLADPQEEKWQLRAAAPEGLAPDGQMSVIDIRNVSDFLCSHRVKVVFPETNVNRDSLKKIISICRERGLHVKIAAIPLYGDTMGREGSGAATYLQMIEHNISTLYEFLSESHEYQAESN